MKIILKSPLQTQKFSQQLAKCCAAIKAPIIIYLQGHLGAGKTTLARGFIQYFGFDKVKSPTYTLLEIYQNNKISIYHFDCYRLINPEEFENIGGRDYAQKNSIQLIEWAENGAGFVAKADIIIEFSDDKNEQRRLCINAKTSIGTRLTQCLEL